MENSVFFRIAAAILIFGASLVAFIVPGILHDHTLLGFRLLYGFASGVILSCGWTMLQPRTSWFSYQTSVFLASISFLCMLVLEHLSKGIDAKRKKLLENSYLALSTSSIFSGEDDDWGGDVSEDDNEDEEEGIQLGDIYKSGLSPQKQTTSLQKRNKISHPTTLSRESNDDEINSWTEFCRDLHIEQMMLPIATATDGIVEGILLSLQEHSSIYSVLSVWMVKVLVTLSISTSLEASDMPRGLALYFMVTLSIAAPCGVLAGVFITFLGKASSNIIIATIHLDTAIGSLAAGVLIYASAVKLTPRAMFSHDEDLLAYVGTFFDNISFAEISLKLVMLVSFLAGVLVVTFLHNL